MNSQLAHSLKLRFGTAPGEPTETQLGQIEQAILSIKQKRAVTDADWQAVVKMFCPSAGTYKYGSIDDSDLNALLATAGAGPKGSSSR